MKPTNFPGRLEQRRKEAKERDAFAASLTPKQKLANLDKKFGKGVGAKRERARLQKLIDHGKGESSKDAPNK